ncbi:MAG TPA: hypothetical protein ENF73_04790, partial [Proteobacteria bacterium]|nr:hypothetical protein [Pseudomonadota bacterium]
MHPVIFRIGGFELRSYGVAMASAFLIAALWLSVRQARKEGIDPDILLGIAFWAIIGIIAGGRALFVITTWEKYFADNPLNAFAVWQGGLVYYGGHIGAFLAALIYVRLYRKKWALPVVDVYMPYAGLG